MTQEANKKLLWKVRLMLIRDCVHSAQKALRTGGQEGRLQYKAHRKKESDIRLLLGTLSKKNTE